MEEFKSKTASVREAAFPCSYRLYFSEKFLQEDNNNICLCIILKKPSQEENVAVK